MKRPNAYFLFLFFFSSFCFWILTVSWILLTFMVESISKQKPNNSYDLCIYSCYIYIFTRRIDISQHCVFCITFILNLINFCSVSCKCQLTQLFIPTFYLPKQMLMFFRRNLSLPKPVLYFRECGISVMDTIVQFWGVWGIFFSWLKFLAGSTLFWTGSYTSSGTKALGAKCAWSLFRKYSLQWET